MKLLQSFKLAAILSATIATFNPIIAVSAQVYGEKDVKQDNFIPVALPLAGGRYNLLLIEQISGKQKCWGESGSSPVKVDLLLNGFDYTGICKTFKDSNGYSIRIDGTDYGLDYRLDIEKTNTELQLVATPISGSNKSKIIIGKTHGFAEGSLKFMLEPGWNFAQRTYENKALGHIYFSGDSVAFGKPSGPAPAFRDIARDIYRSEIEQAVALGFISGFEDKTFRPQESLTRAQLVSMVVEALKTLPTIKVGDLPQPTAAPFVDVPSNYWAAAKIKWAQDNGIIMGYKDRSFKPNQPLTRAELIVALNNVALYAQKVTNKGDKLLTNGQPFNFTDISGDWSERRVLDMSAFCKVASPLNESGTAFFPNNPAQRDYAAAATLRMLKCVNPS